MNMENKGVSEIVEEKTGESIAPGQKGKCPFCGKEKTFAITKDDSMGKCFHPDCGKFITSNQKEISIDYRKEFIDTVCMGFHFFLVEYSKNSRAYNYLLERGIHPKVIKDSMIGVIPRDYNLDIVFDNITETLRDKIIKGSEDSEPKKEFNNLERLKNKLKDCMAKNIGNLVFIYTDKDNKITQIKMRKPFDKKFYIFKFDENKTGVFNHKLLSEELTSDPLLSNIEIVTEGEFNTLQLQSLMIKNGKGYVKSCAIGGVLNADYNTLKAITKNLFICYDNDKSNAGFKLVENTKKHLFFSAFTTPTIDSDLDSFILSYGNDTIKALNDLKNLLLKSKRIDRDYETVATMFLQILLDKDLNRIYKELAVKDLFIKEFSNRCIFYKDNNYNYILIKQSNRIVEISKDCNEIKLMLSQMGVNATHKWFLFIIEELITHCMLHGKKINIYDFAYFDKNSFTLYIHNGEDKIIKISKDQVLTVANGEDNVLFKYRPNNEPFNLIEIDKNINYLDKYLLSKFNLDNDEGSLSCQEQKIIIKYWLFGIFFESIMYTKTILVAIGTTGSGKTFTLKAIGKLLFGDKYNVTPLPSKQEDFDTILTNSYYCVLDNVDSFTPWLNDKLACVATGQTVEKRKLYTDNEKLQLETKCFLAMTSRTPNFTRDDVADRLICIHIKRFKEFQSENDIFQELLTHRNEIITYIIYELQKCIAALHANKDKVIKTKFRIADFSIFCQKIDMYQGNKDNIEGIFDKIIQNQLAFAVENDSLVHTLKIWLSNSNEGREVDARTLFIELNETAKRYNIIDFNYKNAMSVSRRLANISRNIKDDIEVTKVKKRANKTFYKFKLLCEVKAPKSIADGVF